VLNVSSTGCNIERQSLAKVSYIAIDNVGGAETAGVENAGAIKYGKPSKHVLTNLLPAGLQDFFRLLNVWNAMTTVNKLLERSLFVVNDELAHHPVEK